MTGAALLSTAAWPVSAALGDIEATLLAALLQLVVIIVAARICAVIFRRIGQPAVVGEIAAGLMLGPSLFGRFCPEISAALFPTHAIPAFQLISQLGLIFLLFLIGLECEFAHLRERGKAALGISVVGVILPFLLGWGLAHWIYPNLIVPADWPKLDPRGFALFLGTAMSITAIPVLGRIMMELNITKTRIGAITITAAAADDATGWILLAAVSAVVRAEFDPLVSLRAAVLTIAFCGVMIFGARPVLCRWVRSSWRGNDGDVGLGPLAVLLVIIFGCAIATNLIGVFAVFGAFLCGAVLSGEAEFRDTVTRQLRPFITVFFLPIFFTYTGLNTDVGSIENPKLWLIALAVTAVAIVGKFGGCSAAAWLGGFPPREAACIGTLMNARGLMELVVINVGLQLMVIPPSVYCMLVIMALVTTVMTTPSLRWLGRGTELELPMARQVE